MIEDFRLETGNLRCYKESTNQLMNQSSNQLNPHFQYILRLADNALILGQRLSEWCGHGPVLEQDIAITNIALDLIGQSRSWYQYAGILEGKGRGEDDLAYFREAPEFYNVLLVEQSNEDFAYTIVRQFFYDAFNYYLHEKLTDSKDEQVAAIAKKSLKEITYHLRYSSEWVIRLGDGTEVSHKKMQRALNDLWPYSGELVTNDELDLAMGKEGIGVDLETIKPAFQQKIKQILEEATLSLPQESWFHLGGKSGKHTEALSYLLTEMQVLQRTYPGLEW